MIDILYQVGKTVWRESARQLFSIEIAQKNEETGEDVPACAIAVVKEDEMVDVFLKEGDRIEDCNDTIVNAINEVDLRGHRLFASHTLQEFRSRMTANIETVDHVETENGTLQAVASTAEPEPEPAEEPVDVVDDTAEETGEAPAEEAKEE